MGYRCFMTQMAKSYRPSNLILPLPRPLLSFTGLSGFILICAIALFYWVIGALYLIRGWRIDLGHRCFTLSFTGLSGIIPTLPILWLANQSFSFIGGLLSPILWLANQSFGMHTLPYWLANRSWPSNQSLCHIRFTRSHGQFL